MTLKVTIDGIEYRPCVPEIPGFHTFRQLMRANRNGLGWTLDEACKQIGCSKSYLFGMEAGTNEPSLRMAFKISQAYDISMKRLALSLDATSEGQP
jgi:transcriptional regulator with XRE-family HTH domain